MIKFHWWLLVGLMICLLGCTSRGDDGTRGSGISVTVESATNRIHISIDKPHERTEVGGQGWIGKEMYHYDLFVPVGGMLDFINPEIGGPDVGKNGFGYMSFDLERELVVVRIYKPEYDIEAINSQTKPAIIGHSRSYVWGEYKVDGLRGILTPKSK